MKKFNFKALLVLVLSFMLIFALTACDPDPEPEPEPDPTASEIFLEAMGGLDTTIASLANLTDTFDVDLDLYAIVNEVEYNISIKANLDISEEGNNDNNKAAIEVTKDEEVVFGFYYNGAEDAVFLNIPSQDIARYMTGVDLYDLATQATKEEGQQYYTSFIDFNLVQSIGSTLVMVADTLFEPDVYDVTEAGGKTTYTFYLAEDLFNETIPGLVGLVGTMVDIDGFIDTIFGTEGFKLSQMTIPPVQATFQIINGANGFEELKILATVDQFVFKINNDDPGKTVNALDIETGIRLNTLAPKGTEYAVSLSLPSVSDTDSDYEYFSPANIETSGVLQIDNDVYTFDVKTDINPFKIQDAEIYVNVTENSDTLILIRTYEGVLYLEGSVFDQGPIQVSVEDAIDLVKDLIKNLDKITLPDLGDIEDTASAAEPDILAALMLIPDALTDDGLFADKKLIDDVLEALDLTFDDMKDDVTLEVIYEMDEDEEKIVKITGELWMANIVDPTATEKTYEDIETYNLVIDISYDADDKLYLFEIEVKENESILYEATLEILYKGEGESKTFDGFEYNHTIYDGEESEALLVKLTDFEFTWGYAVAIDQTGYDAINSEDYADGLEGVTALTIIDEINALLAKLFSPEETTS